MTEPNKCCWWHEKPFSYCMLKSEVVTKTLTLTKNPIHAGLLHRKKKTKKKKRIKYVSQKAMEQNGNERVVVAFWQAERFTWE